MYRGLIRNEEPLQIKEIEPGIYSVINAYDGVYEYFKGKPLFKVVDGKITDLLPENKPISSAE